MKKKKSLDNINLTEEKISKIKKDVSLLIKKARKKFPGVNESPWTCSVHLWTDGDHCVELVSRLSKEVALYRHGNSSKVDYIVNNELKR